MGCRLRRQRDFRNEHDGAAAGGPHPFDRARVHERLSGAGDAQEDLILFSGVDAGDEFGDGTGLVALGLVGGGELEVHLCRIVDMAVGSRLGICAILEINAEGAVL